jgi:peptidoglycan/xylan/chitin deacetylase (PgdA/CDA1 family)
MKPFKRKRDVLVPVILYHNVGPFRPGTNPALTIPVETFEEHIRWLKRHGYTGIRSSDWLAWCRDGKELPHKPVMLTFDDAYADCAEYALPILARHGFHAAIFVVTGQIGGTNAWSRKNLGAALPCMTEEQIRRWAAQGFEFGSHTHTHPDLRTLGDDEIANEMRGSAQHLSNLLGLRVHSFAYPYGDYSEAVKRWAEQTFDLAFTCDEGLNTRGTDRYLLRRKMVHPGDTLLDLAAYVKLGWSRRRLRRWRRDLRRRLVRSWHGRVARAAEKQARELPQQARTECGIPATDGASRTARNTAIAPVTPFRKLPEGRKHPSFWRLPFRLGPEGFRTIASGDVPQRRRKKAA